MSFKGFVLLAVAALIIYSIINIQNHNPLSHSRLEKDKKEKHYGEDF